MAKKSLELGFGYPITIGPKDYVLLENCYNDWWIAVEDDTNNQATLLLIKAQFDENGDLVAPD